MRPVQPQRSIAATIEGSFAHRQSAVARFQPRAHAGKLRDGPLALKTEKGRLRGPPWNIRGHEVRLTLIAQRTLEGCSKDHQYDPDVAVRSGIPLDIGSPPFALLDTSQRCHDSWQIQPLPCHWASSPQAGAASGPHRRPGTYSSALSAASTARPMARRSRSPSGRPSSSMPTGRPSGVRPMGSDRPGAP